MLPARFERHFDDGCLRLLAVQLLPDVSGGQELHILLVSMSGGGHRAMPMQTPTARAGANRVRTMTSSPVVRRVLVSPRRQGTPFSLQRRGRG